MFGEAWPSMSVPALAPDDDDDEQTVVPGHIDILDQYRHFPTENV